MIWRLAARLFLVGILLALAGFSPFWPPPITGGYIGPGDIYAFTSFYSCSVAVNKVSAQNGTTKGCNIVLRTIFATVTNLIITEAGSCDTLFAINGITDLNSKLACNGGTQTLAAWGAIRQQGTITCTGSASGTTLTIPSPASCTGGTPQLYMQVDTTGSAIYIKSQIDSTHWGLNASYSAGSGTRTLRAPSTRVFKFYDQLGSTTCGGDCSVTRTGATDHVTAQFGFGTDGACSLPLSITACAHNDGGNAVGYVSAGTFTAPSTLGVGAVGMSVSGTNTYLKAAGLSSSTDTSNGISDNVAGAAWFGSVTGSAACISTPATNSVIHSDVGVLKGANSTMTLDGTASSPAACLPSGTSGSVRLFGRAGENTSDIYWAGFGGTDMSAATQCKLTNRNNQLFGTAKGSC